MSSPAPVLVLNINDHEASRYALTRVMEGAGFIVREAASGEAGLALAQENPDVIVLDVRLPDVNGFEVCRRLKADSVTRPIAVVLTSAAFVRAEDRAVGLDGGADGYLIQPVEPIELIATVRALTRARRAEQERAELLERAQTAQAAAEAAREQAEATSRMKDEFVATVSHELRTPLNAVLGWARMLRSGALSDEKRARALETIERNAQAQAELVEDLLDISRIVSGNLRLAVRPVDLAAVVTAALDTIRPAVDAKSIDLRVEIVHTCPLTADPGRLHQVVANLLTNAVKFTPAGGWVSVVVRQADRTVELSVADSGRGIASAFLPFVFDRFRQGDGSVTRLHGGLGLGLAIVRHLVELHGGTVAAESEGDGQGARFTVRLPCGDLEIPSDAGRLSDPGAPPARETLTTPPRLSGMHALVVDDEIDARELICEVLTAVGATVTTVGSAAEALGLLTRVRPDVIVADIGMPGIDGYTLIREVRALTTNAGGRTPAVAVTAFARSEDRSRAFIAGFNAHVPKPLEPTELLAVVASVAGRRSRA